MRSLTLVATLAVLGCGGGDDDAAGPIDAAAVDAATDAPPAIDAAIDAPGEVEGPADLELGHVEPIVELYRTGTRALSVDSTGRAYHWVLWDLATRAIVAQGDRLCPVNLPCPTTLAELRGGLVTVHTDAGLELRSAATGAVSATVATSTARAGTASDGSYVWAATAAGLRAWHPDGSMFIDVAGDYHGAAVFAAPAELRVALGPAASMIEKVRIADGMRTTAAYNGSFHSWFVDGGRFLTITGNLVRAVNLDGSNAGLGMVSSVQNLTGQGDHVWTYADHEIGNPLDIYTVAPFARVQSYNLGSLSKAVPAGHTIGLVSYGLRELSIVTLGAAVTRSPSIDTPVTYLEAYGAADDGWLVGNRWGVVVPGTGTTAGGPLSKGAVRSAAGTAGGVAAVATASGAILLLHAGDNTSVFHTIARPSGHLELSTDGAVLVAGPDLWNDAQFREETPLDVYDVASAAVTHGWPYTRSGDPTFLDYSFARSGLMIAHYLNGTGLPTPVGRAITRIDGTMLADYGAPAGFGLMGLTGVHLFSPDGRRAAQTPAYGQLYSATTTLYHDGAIVEAVDGAAVGWLDDDRVLIARYRASGGGNPTPILDADSIYTGDGVLVAATMLPDLRPFEDTTSHLRGAVFPAGGGLVYVPQKDAVYDPMVAAPFWQGPADGHGLAVAGDHVLYLRGTRIVVERFRP